MRIRTSRRIVPTLAVLVGAAGVAACTTAVVRPEAGDARWAQEKWPGTTVSDLEHGRSVFVSRCAGCHNLPRPDAKSPDDWAGVLDEMASRAKVTPADKDLVLRYLSAASERLRRGGG
jgi:cytochrome c5